MTTVSLLLDSNNPTMKSHKVIGLSPEIVSFLKITLKLSLISSLVDPTQFLLFVKP